MTLISQVTPLDRSNSLTDLAARIRTEHEAVSLALKRGVTHAMMAGDLLLEAKLAVPHGRWLQWLTDNCDALSERTVQLYMKLAKNRVTIEKEMANPQSVADLTLNEAAALCVLAGRLKKLMEFVKQAETASPEEVVSLCVQQGFTVIHDDNYNKFAGRSEAEQREWILFGYFIGNGSESAFDHVEWLLQRPFQNVDEWLGPKGDKCRANWGMKPVPDKFRKAWAKFKIKYADKTQDKISTEVQDNRARHKTFVEAAE
jgi:hypothetical protein